MPIFVHNKKDLMMLSMTGYGKSLVQLHDKKITVEIRTLNSKNVDLNLRIPSAYKELELPIRKQVAQHLLRGKIEVSVHIEKTGLTATPQLDVAVLNNYIQQLQSVDSLSLSKADQVHLLATATGFPEVFKSSETVITDQDKETITSTVQHAVNEVISYRSDEGAVLANEFTTRIKNIAVLLDKVIELDVTRLDAIRTRLEKAVKDIKESVDQNRFEQELIFYLEKYDITEEKVRLKNHLDYFTSTMSQPSSQGKKLGFITQEIGREINTIGSKANHAELQQVVVQMKDELEKIKEQLLNVL